MSWIESVKNDLVITTGEGSEFRPDYTNVSKNLSFNISEFNFPNIEGTYVERRLPKGEKYNLEIHFQGENHLEQTRSFEAASADPRPWNIDHPYYGPLTVQPTSLSVDNTKDNVTKIAGLLLATIAQDGLEVGVSAPDEVAIKVEELNISGADVVAINRVESTDVSKLTEDNEKTFNKYVKAADSDTALNTITNTYNEAAGKVALMLSKPKEAMAATQALLLLPSNLEASVSAKYKLLRNEVDTLIKTAVGLSDGAKRILASTLSALFGGMAISSTSNANYDTRQDVSDQIGRIKDTFNVIIKALEDQQSGTFNPDSGLISELEFILHLTISNLYDIALDSKQERSVILTEDSNIILLSHKYFGPNSTEKFMTVNEVMPNEILILRKGRKVLYYV